MPTMKDHLVIMSVGVAAAINLHAQIPSSTSEGEPLSFYHPFTLTPADGAGGGARASDTKEAEGGMSQEELANMAQNPVANLMSFPLQNNFNFGVWPNNAVQYVMNFQPVIPITLNE